MAKRTQTERFMTGYRTDFRRTVYRDKGREFLFGPACKICSKKLERKVAESGRIEGWQQFLRRKTCGLLPNGKRTECSRLAIRGEGNPKWRGGLPKCKKCFKQTAWYKNTSKNNPQRYCHHCFMTILAEKARERGRLMAGIYPEALRPFAFKKGMVPHNKNVLSLSITTPASR